MLSIAGAFRRTPLLAVVFFALTIVGLGAHSVVTEGAEDSEINDIRLRRRLVAPEFTTSKMIENFNTAKTKYLSRLAKDYGAEDYKRIFMINATTSQALITHKSAASGVNGASWDRLVQKMMKKILKAQIAGSKGQFVWATGGHSAAAAHGDLYNESYTKIMEKFGSGIFDAVGLTLHGRAYASGATASGMEIGGCAKEIFGTNIDILSWDYGMTDAGRSAQPEWYAYRGALIPSRPAIVALYTNRFADVFYNLERQGVPVFMVDLLREFDQRFPDTAGKKAEDVAKLGVAVQYYRCGKKIEDGDPGCGRHKWTHLVPASEPCNKRKYQVSWHPGWKWHAARGHLNTLFLMEIIDRALKEIKSKGSDPKALLDQLTTMEDNRYKNFTGVPRHRTEVKGFDQFGAKIPADVLYKKHNFCHTARLPAQYRYKGLATDKNGPQGKGGENDYDKGSEIKSLRGKEWPNMPLAWDERGRQTHCTKYEIQKDFKDFFYANSLGWSKLTVPNARARGSYKFIHQSDLQGYIAICFAGCDWRCPEEAITINDINAGKGKIKVNEEPVTKVTLFGEDCFWLQNKNGYKFASNSVDLYDVAAKSEDSTKYFRISTIMVF